MRERITQPLIRSAEIRPRPYEIRDSLIKGFLLRIQPTGRKTFVVEYGRGKRLTIGNAAVITLNAARLEAKRILGMVALGEDPKKASGPIPTLGDYLANHHFPSLREKRNGHKRINEIEKHFTYLFSAGLDEITDDFFEKWRASQTLKPTTVYRIESSLRGVLTNARKKYELPPLAGRDKVRQRSVVRYLKAGERKRLMAALDQSTSPALKPMVVVALGTGLRRTELLELLWADIDFNAAVLTVRPESSKTEKLRHIPMNAAVYTVLKNWRGQTTSTRVFPFPDIPKKAWATALRRAEVPGFRWHDCRHDFGSQLAMKNVSPAIIQELMGHTDFATTSKYLHLSKGVKAAAVQALVEDD